MLHLTQSKVHFIFQAKKKLEFFDLLVRKNVEIRITMKTKVEITHVSSQSLAHSIVDLRVFWTMACSLSNEASLRNC